MRSGYHNASETVRECPHQVKRRTENGWEWESTWMKWKPEKYHGLHERCSMCHAMRKMELSGDTVRYTQQLSLFDSVLLEIQE